MKLFLLGILVNSSLAVNIRGNTDTEDLFNDDSQEAETLKSINDSEKALGYKLGNSFEQVATEEIMNTKNSLRFDQENEFTNFSARDVD